MPTPYFVSPDEDLEDDSFSRSLANDIASDNDPEPTPAVAPSPSAAGGGGVVLAPQTTPKTPTPPVYTPPDRTDLNRWEQSYQQDSRALDRNDPALKPRSWERVGGGVAAALMAFGRNPNAVSAASQFVNRRYNTAEEARQGRLAADRVGIDAAQSAIRGSDQDFERNIQGYNAQLSAQRNQSLAADRAAQQQQRLQSIAPGTEAPDDPSNPMGPWHATTIGGQQIALAQPPEKWLKTPAGTAAQREADVKRLGLTGDDAKFYRANGKLKEPTPSTNIRMPSAESEELAMWRSAFRKDNGREPNAQEIAAFKHGGGGSGPKTRGTPAQFSALTKQTQEAYAKAEKAYRDAVAISTTDEERNAAKDVLEQEKKRIGEENSQRLRDLGGIPAEDSAPAQQPPAPQQAKVKAGVVKVGDPVTDGKGRKGTVVGIAPNGKPQVKWSK